MRRIPGIYFADTTSRGRGVFTAQAIDVGALIEICPLIIIPNDQVAAIHDTVLHDYYFYCGVDSQTAAIALGFGSLYNHDAEANVAFEINMDTQEMYITCIRQIEVGREITLHYNDADDPRAKLWF